MKKLIDILFESEEEVVVDEPLTSVNKPTAPSRPAPRPQQVKPSSVSKIQDKDVLQRPVHSKSFGIIDVEELQVKKPQAVKKAAPVEEKHYESQPPMSPIFGVLKDSEENVLKTPQIVSSKDSHLGTVLSPIYGLKTNPDLEVSEDVKAEPFDDIKVQEVQPIKEIKPIKFDQDDDLEFINVSLDEIIKHNDDTFVAEQEISLFDDIEEEK